jgi:hypothetical protein
MRKFSMIAAVTWALAVCVGVWAQDDDDWSQLPPLPPDPPAEHIPPAQQIPAPAPIRAPQPAAPAPAREKVAERVSEQPKEQAREQVTEPPAGTPKPAPPQAAAVPSQTAPIIIMADDDAISSLNEHIESLNEYNTALVTQYNVLAAQYDSVIELNKTLKGAHPGGLFEDVKRHHLPFLVISGILVVALIVLFIICMRLNSNLKGFGEKLLVVEKDKEKLYKNFTDLKAEKENLRQELREAEAEKKDLALVNADLAKRLEEAVPESDKETKSYQLTYSDQTPIYTELPDEPRNAPPKAPPL